MQPSSVVEMHIKIIWTFVRLVMLKRVLHDVLPETKIDFWRIVQGTSLDAALIEWCKVFGSTSDDTHWSKLIQTAQHDDFRKNLWTSVEMNEMQWKTYWSTMKDYRDQAAAHHDLNMPPNGNYPSFDTALEASYFYYNSFLYPTWFTENPATIYPPDMKAYAVNYRAELLKVAEAAANATKHFEL